MTNLVSIGLPVYNGEKFIEEAIQSILSQTHKHLEIIICDNGSTDRTHEICRSYEARDSRIRYHRNKTNLGAAPNFNRTFELARGKYFKWAAHDDILSPVYIEKCVKKMNANPNIVLCFSRTQVIDENGVPLNVKNVHPSMLSSRPSDRWYGHVYIGGHVCYPIFGVVRSDALARTPLIGSFTESDRVLLACLALSGDLYELPETLLYGRDHPDRSVRATEPHLRAAWFDTRHGDTISFPKWRLLVEFSRVIAQSNVSPVEKRRCYRILAAWTLNRLPVLARDLRNALWSIAGSLRYRYGAANRERCADASVE